MQPSNEGVIAKREEAVDAWSSLSTNQIDGVARRDTHCHERSSHDDARSVEPLGAVDEHPPSSGHERGDEHGQLAHFRVDVITVVHREAHIELAERYGRCPGRLPSSRSTITSTSRVPYSELVSSLVAMDKAGTTSNTCIFQPGGAGIGSPRIFETLSQHGAAGSVPQVPGAWVIHDGADGATYGRSRPWLVSPILVRSISAWTSTKTPSRWRSWPQIVTARTSSGSRMTRRRCAGSLAALVIPVGCEPATRPARPATNWPGCWRAWECAAR